MTRAIGTIRIGMAFLLVQAALLTAAEPQRPRSGVSDALQNGVRFLQSRQQDDGSWLHHPAITALACAAVHSSAVGSAPAAAAAVDRGLDFVVGNAHADGAIWHAESRAYANYCTSICLVALAVGQRPQDQAVLRRARNWLLAAQVSDQPESDPAFGGIGYGKTLRPDLSNTQWALEALYLTDYLDREPHGTDDPERAAAADRAWQRALRFLGRCQNLREVNDQGWVLDDPDNRGGFVYMPGESKAGEVERPDTDSVGLRSYGSMTYAGLKSMLYAQVDRDDLRVRAAVDWVRRHCTFAEHPGLGQAGFFYYLHTCAKALSAYGEDTLVDHQGQAHDWRAELAAELVKRQRANGSWWNVDGRWMESVPELATCYAVLALNACSDSAAAGTNGGG